MTTQQPALLSLPTEIRLGIYRHLLIQPLPIRQKGFYEMWSGSDLPTLEHDILRTCRQIHDEALPLLYGENVFYDYVEDHGPWGAHRDYLQNYGFPCHHLDLMRHVNLKIEWQTNDVDDYTARSIQYYVQDRAALMTFTMRLGHRSYKEWLLLESQLGDQSKTAEALAALGESVELIIIAWAVDDVGVDALKELRLAVAPEDQWVTGKQYNQGHYHCTGRLWRCGPGKRLH